MDLVSPGIGLIFWTSLVFIILMILLRVFAWKPILTMVNKRNDSIENALKQAEIAREDMKKLQTDHELMMEQAKQERDKIFAEAREMKEQLMQKAKDETDKMVTKMKADAKAEIEGQKQAAINELKQQVAEISIDIAEKILKSELEDKKKQEAMVNQLLKEVELN
ncbi:MAG: F0F1 ATP synthase subunit B [Bacteroidales bacterium]|jgi:F-type H+-transporting ATPase subunit b|nr:F0F1 ATP synthase subunit B [Bacteroidales bacterium]